MSLSALLELKSVEPSFLAISTFKECSLGILEDEPCEDEESLTRLTPPKNLASNPLTLSSKSLEPIE